MKLWKYFLLSFLGILLLIPACGQNTQNAAKIFPVFFQFDASCDYGPLVPGEIRRQINASSFVIIGTDATMDEIKKLEKHPCVIRSFKRSDLQKVLSLIESDFDTERDEHFKALQMKRSLEHKDVIGKDNLNNYIQKMQRELPSTVLSQYQLFVTPDAEAVQKIAKKVNDTQEIFNTALSWLWVSEQYLNGEEEHWYTPEEFLTVTPSLDTNPSPGTIASDCSEQANTLASLFLAKGYDAENVRVVLGLVDFSGQTGGHAWVELYEDGQWIPLDPTSGAYFDESTETVTEAGRIPYTYFKYHSYPVEERWYYYNNVYFLDVITNTGNAPQNWQEESRSRLRDDLESFAGKV